MLIFGCEPQMKVNADSCLIDSFLKRVKASRLKNNAVVLPGKILNFRTKNGGESVCSYNLELHFFGPDPLAIVDLQDSNEETKAVTRIS